MIEEIEKSIRESLSSYIFDTNTKETICSIIYRHLSYYQSNLSIPKEAVQFEADPTDAASLIPANLFTLLLMQGVFVNYDEVKDKTEYTVDDKENILYGCIFSFCPHSATQAITLPKPVKSIRIDMQIDKVTQHNKRS